MLELQQIHAVRTMGEDTPPYNNLNSELLECRKTDWHLLKTQG